MPPLSTAAEGRRTLELLHWKAVERKLTAEDMGVVMAALRGEVAMEDSLEKVELPIGEAPLGACTLFRCFASYNEWWVARGQPTGLMALPHSADPLAGFIVGCTSEASMTSMDPKGEVIGKAMLPAMLAGHEFIEEKIKEQQRIEAMAKERESEASSQGEAASKGHRVAGVTIDPSAESITIMDQDPQFAMWRLYGTIARVEAALSDIIRLAEAIGARGAALGSGAAEELSSDQQAEWALAALDFCAHPAFWLLSMPKAGDESGKHVAAGTNDGYTVGVRWSRSLGM